VPISRFWICDSGGRILGPLTLESLQQLVRSGRIKQIVRIRRDSERWQRPEHCPELAAALGTSPPRSSELAEARVTQIRSWLEQVRSRPAWEVLGVSREASVETYRAAFFRLVKPYHPSRLPEDSPADLRQAAAEAFQLLSSLMLQVESAKGTSTPPLGSGHLANQAPAHTKRTVQSAKQQPSYGPEEFVGIEQSQDMVQATVKVSGQNVGIFTDHFLVNLATQGVFLPTSRYIRLGTLVEIRFVFQTAARQIQARGRVVCVNVGVPSSQPGLGVRFLRLDNADRLFIEHFVEREKSLAGNRSTA